MNQPKQTILHTGQFLALIREGHWEYVDRVNAPGAAIIVAVTTEQKVLLMEQYRTQITPLAEFAFSGDHLPPAKVHAFDSGRDSWMLKWMRTKPRTIGRQGRHTFSLIALLFVLLSLPACVSPPKVATVASPVITGQPVSMDNILVTLSSSAGDLTAERQLLGDSLISGLKQTGLFVMVTGNPAELGAGDGIRISVEITTIKKVTDNARAWTGALAGRARLVVRVTVNDLKSGQRIERFAAEGQSGESAFAGTTDEAIQMVVQQVVAEILQLNAQSAR